MKIIIILFSIILFSCSEEKVEVKPDVIKEHGAERLPCDTELAKLIIEEHRLEMQQDSIWNERHKIIKQIEKLTLKVKE